MILLFSIASDHDAYNHTSPGPNINLKDISNNAGKTGLQNFIYFLTFILMLTLYSANANP